RVAERDRFVNDQWPRIAEHIELLGLDAADLLESERA
ncbi:MAG: GntR family transcriptional regulator, partial [Proteobacteria bacterium]|nr:GntR family transcriptional regulator [Pseudomonadota bacterium]